MIRAESMTVAVDTMNNTSKMSYTKRNQNITDLPPDILCIYGITN